MDSQHHQKLLVDLFYISNLLYLTKDVSLRICKTLVSLERLGWGWKWWWWWCARTERAHILKNTWWELGSFIPDNLKKKLGPTELSFLSAYAKTLQKYMTLVDSDLNLVWHTHTHTHTFARECSQSYIFTWRLTSHCVCEGFWTSSRCFCGGACSGGLWNDSDR